MYLGKVVETAAVDPIFHDPKHPYTRALHRSIPKFGDTRRGRLEAIRGMVPHPFARPTAAPFTRVARAPYRESATSSHRLPSCWIRGPRCAACSTMIGLLAPVVPARPKREASAG